MRSAAAAAFLLLTAAAPMVAGHGHGDGHGHGNGGMSVNAKGEVTDCSDIELRFDGAPAMRGEDRLNVAGRELSIDLTGTHGMPMRVTGSDRAGYDVRLCKGAESSTTLGAVRIEKRGGDVVVTGPDSERWGGYLLVSAPRDAQLKVASGNGPVSIAEVGGELDAKVKNGPLSLRNVSGRVNASVVNGPLSFSGRSGDVRLDAQNGPVSLTLDGSSWEGGELHANAKNGPVTLRVPDAYGSGVVVDRGEYTPFHCAASLCGPQASERPESGARSVSIGTGATRVRLASENGPISIKSR